MRGAPLLTVLSSLAVVLLPAGCVATCNFDRSTAANAADSSSLQEDPTWQLGAVGALLKQMHCVVASRCGLRAVLHVPRRESRARPCSADSSRVLPGGKGLCVWLRFFSVLLKL
jgi:hypothetical protein